MTMFSSQPVFSIAQENIDDDVEATESGLVTPQMMKARMRGGGDAEDHLVQAEPVALFIDADPGDKAGVHVIGVEAYRTPPCGGVGGTGSRTVR